MSEPVSLGISRLVDARKEETIFKQVAVITDQAGLPACHKII